MRRSKYCQRCPPSSTAPEVNVVAETLGAPAAPGTLGWLPPAVGAASRKLPAGRQSDSVARVDDIRITNVIAAVICLSVTATFAMAASAESTHPCRSMRREHAGLPTGCSEIMSAPLSGRVGSTGFEGPAETPGKIDNAKGDGVESHAREPEPAGGPATGPAYGSSSVADSMAASASRAGSSLPEQPMIWPHARELRGAG